MTTTLDKNYRLTLPKELREKTGFKAGTPLEVTFSAQGMVIFAALHAAVPPDPDSIARERFRKVMDMLWESEPDPTMVAPPEIPWELDAPRIPIE